MNRTFLVVAVLAALASPLPVQAGELDALVRGWYRAHQDEERAPAALRLVRPHASKRLAALIAREERCKTRTRELCNLEFNVIVNGQDWELKRVHVEAAKVSDARARVTARFINIETPQEIVYTFVQEAGRWKLDDIESRSDERWTLSRLLTP